MVVCGSVNAKNGFGALLFRDTSYHQTTFFAAESNERCRAH